MYMAACVGITCCVYNIYMHNTCMSVCTLYMYNVYAYLHPRTQTCWLCLSQTQSLLAAQRIHDQFHNLINPVYLQRGNTSKTI